MRILILVALGLVIAAAPAAAEIWTYTIESPEFPRGVITVDIGQQIESLDSVAFHVTGYDLVGGYSCDSMSGTFYYPEFHMMMADFGQGIEGDADDLYMDSFTWDDTLDGPDFDYTYEYDLSDAAFWSFLDDGPVDFTFDYDMASYSPSGFCIHIHGEFFLYSATLIISYNGSVANERNSWAAVKALYR